MEPTLEVTLLGELSARSMDLPAAPPVTRFRTQKTAALFAYLAWRAGRANPREELIDRFWPDADLEAGRMSLRTSLSALRKDFGEHLHADKATVVLQAHTDVQRFEQCLRAARNEKISKSDRIAQLGEAVKGYGGSLLPGTYEEWALRERDRLESEYRAALSALARWHERLDELPLALEYARLAVVSDPYSEDARSDLIHVLKRMGRPGEARRQFDDLARLLREQMDAEPSESLRALVTGIAVSPEISASEPVCMVSLPVSRGRFRGRRETLNTLIGRLSAGKREEDSPRLFTLFGPGGIGKTRLAIEAARRLVAHGIVRETWFISIAHTSASEDIWISILATLQLTPSSEMSPLTQIAARLAKSDSSLLILDNLEQIALEAGEIAESLLHRIPSLTILATSRRRLGTPGESLIAVEPLQDDEAIGLFLDRARSVTPEFASQQPDREKLGTLMRLLEGFPLAIELAAAWTAVLHPDEILAKLEAGILNLPEQAQGDVRQRSLATTIQWSVDLLGIELRRAFFALSIFRGSWDAAAAVAICNVEWDALASLRDRSLITADADSGTMRFSMHQSLREFGQTTFSPSESEPLTERFVHYFLTFAETSRQEHLIADHANLRAAFDAAGVEQQRRFGLALASFWEKQGHWREGRQALERILAHELETVPTSSQAELVSVLGQLCFHLCDFAASRTHHEEALRLYETLGEVRGMGATYYALAALVFHTEANLPRARELAESALEAYTQAGDMAGQAKSLGGLGVAASVSGDYLAARQYQQRSLALCETAQLASPMATAHRRLGMVADLLGEPAEAEWHYNQAREIFEQSGEPVNAAYVRVDQGVLAYRLGDYETAEAHYEAGYRIFNEAGEMWASGLCLGNMARNALAMGNYRRSIIFWEESLRIRLAIQEETNKGAALNGIAALLFNLSALQRARNLGEDAVRLHAASARLQAESGIKPDDVDVDPEMEQAVRHLLGEADVVRLTSEGTALSWPDAAEIALRALQAAERLASTVQTVV